MQGKRANVNTELRYSEAVSLYSDSDLSIKNICERTGVGFCGFSTYLSKYHRELIIKRHNLTKYANVKLRGSKGQTTSSHYKYKDAIAACDSVEYIEYNISQIARIFNVDCSSLANQLRRHYPEIVPRREKERKRMGIAANLQYGVRKCSKEAYGAAVELLQSSEMTIEGVAETCDVSYAGLREHILAYYPQITLQREKKRIDAVGQNIRGMRNGTWSIHEPDQTTVEKYKAAIEIYRTTSTAVEDIARMAGVNLSSFRTYLRTWHPELMVQRRGFEVGVDINATKRYKKSTAEKYADAIERLKNTDLPTSKIASEFGLNPETFRKYVKEHYPELAAVRGKIKTDDGRKISYRSAEKYAEALHLYETTSESLASIAKRLGVTYNSIGGFIRRNHPEAIEKHNTLLVSSAVRFKKGIKMLQESNASINAVMQQFGYNEYFREYVKTNHPELLKRNTQRKLHTETKIVAEIG